MIGAAQLGLESSRIAEETLKRIIYNILLATSGFHIDFYL